MKDRWVQWKWGYLCNLLPISSFLLSFPPKLRGQNYVGSEGLFSAPFSFFLVFSLEPNKRKFHFPPYFPLLLFHLPYFHPNQTGPYDYSKPKSLKISILFTMKYEECYLWINNGALLNLEITLFLDRGSI